jgi:Flp pilus assembly protein TadB
MMRQLAGIAILIASGSLLVYALLSWRIRQRSVGRFERDDGRPEPAIGDSPGRLRQWLARAGYRAGPAPALFCLALAASAAIGWVVAQYGVAPLTAGVALSVLEIPGGVGGLLAAAVTTVPWVLLGFVALFPVVAVRAARRQLVREIEEDLPLVLELFATLAEAGLSFDAALSRILGQGPRRTLARELVAFQRDILAGVPRIQALRQLAHRLDVPSLTTFISAIVQAEQIGASIAETLRRQADDLRDRRRERALLLAQALPVKLVFPLITCFLPGIFISTLGPVLFQMIQVADSVLRGSR